MKKLLLTLLICLCMAMPASADDTVLYGLITGQDYAIEAGGTEYSMRFIGDDPQYLDGVSILEWKGIIEHDGYRYKVPMSLYMPFQVWDGFIEIDVRNGENVTVFRFVPDWQLSLVQVCPDLRFFPAGGGEE
jgi:hypothetical protein